MIKTLLTLLLAATSYLTATPILPDLLNDGRSIRGSSLIGAQITGDGRYFFALEDLPCPVCDYDFNDLWGEVTVSNGFITFGNISGLGDYFNRGLVGFAGSTYFDSQLALVFNTPTGQMFSGTSQVLLLRLDPVPEPTPADLTLAALAPLLFWAAIRRRASNPSPPTCDHC